MRKIFATTWHISNYHGIWLLQETGIKAVIDHVWHRMPAFLLSCTQGTPNSPAWLACPVRAKG